MRYNSTKFILQHGDEVTKLHLLQFIDMLETKKGKDLILHLLRSQMPSGGFPSKFHEETEGIRETCRNTLLLLKCGIPHNRLNIQSAVNYLLKYQREDGGWRPFWTRNSDPTYTVLTLKLLVWLDAINPEELRKKVAIYV